jgi:hypothetical protein
MNEKEYFAQGVEAFLIQSRPYQADWKVGSDGGGTIAIHLKNKDADLFRFLAQLTEH